MRKFLMSLTVLAGVTVATVSATQAHPAAIAVPVFNNGAAVQPVQYYEGERYREWRRHEEWVRWHRHEEWRRRHAYYGR